MKKPNIIDLFFHPLSIFITAFFGFYLVNIGHANCLSIKITYFRLALIVTSILILLFDYIATIEYQKWKWVKVFVIKSAIALIGLNLGGLTSDLFYYKYPPLSSSILETALLTSILIVATAAMQRYYKD